MLYPPLVDAEALGVLKQSPRSANVTDVENLIDDLESARRRIEDLESVVNERATVFENLIAEVERLKQEFVTLNRFARVIALDAIESINHWKRYASAKEQDKGGAVADVLRFKSHIDKLQQELPT